MEELLNKLIEKGWRPFGFIVQNIRKWPYDSRYYFFENCAGWKSLRELVSKESGLWQFVCENNLIQTEHWWFIDNWERAKNVFYKIDTYDEEWDVIQTWDMEWDKFIWINEYEYRLIESALCDEDKLEKFLLENIKIS